ncbi:MAG: VCBS repeat-containing protein [Bryobacteraceae bacterium]
MKRRAVLLSKVVPTAGLLTFSLMLIAATAFPPFRLKSELQLRPVSLLTFIFHHEENIPVTIVAGDFNGDGRPDLVVGSLWDNEYSNEISFFAGEGDGSFAAPSVIRLNARPQQIQTADFNGDGVSDVALITKSQGPDEGNRLWVFPGSKSGLLKPSYVFPLRDEPSAVFIADFDNDGKLDLAVSSYRSAFLVFPGRGDGTFEEPVLACRCDVSLVADFNRDHRPDLVARDGAYATVRMNRGNGTFARPSTFKGQEFREPVSAGDLNGDGIADLVFSNRLAQGISIYLGNGDGTFRASGSLAARDAVSAVRIADLDGDGFPDILATVWRRTSGELWIFPGSGNGAFRSPVPIRTGYTPSDMCVADFNLDRKPDVAVSSEGALSVSIFLQTR